MRFSKILAGSVLVLLTALAFQAVAQGGKHWVFFSGKDTVGYDCRAFLSEAALANRLALGLPARQYSDIPVSESVLAQLKQAGIVPEVQSRWLNAVTVRASEAQLDWLREQPFVAGLAPVRQRVLPARANKARPALGVAVSFMEPEAFAADTLDGTGVTVGVVDAGFFRADKSSGLKHLFEDGRILGVRDFVSPGKTDHFGDRETGLDGHGTTVLEMIAGKDEKLQSGFAYNASFYLARTDHGKKEFRGEEDYWVAAIEWLDSLGVRLVNTSLGYALGFDDPAENYSPEQMDGKTSVVARAAHIAAHEKGMLLVVSAGNEGSDPRWGIIATPADAEAVLSVGAVTASGLKAGYSSTGPDFLPYLKPNVSCFALGGTSFSAPVVTGFAACLLQKKPAASNWELFAAVEKSGRFYPYGNNYLGHGTPMASAALNLLLGGDSLTGRPLLVDAKGSDQAMVNTGDDEAKQAVVFHKLNATQVETQRMVNLSGGKATVARPGKNIRYTTLATTGGVFEIDWGEE